MRTYDRHNPRKLDSITDLNLNKVFLIGRLAADPETRTTPNGQNVTTLRIATNRVWNNRQTGQKQEQTEFHTIVAWGALGDVAAKYLHKGGLALFEGRLQTRSWDGQDGVKRYRTEIIAEGLQLGPRSMNVGGGYQPANSVPTPSSYAKNSDGTSAAASVKEEDIPVINQDEPVLSDPVTADGDVEEKEIDLKDIPF